MHKQLSLITLSLIFIGCGDAAMPLKVEQTNVPAPAEQVEDDHHDSAPRIELADAKAAFDDGTAVFIDSRDEAYWKANRIKGSLNMTEANVDKRYSELPKGKKIIVYCS